MDSGLLMLLFDGGTLADIIDAHVTPLTPAEIADGLAGRFTGMVPMRLKLQRRSLSYQFIDDITDANVANAVPQFTLDNDRAVLRDVRGLEFFKNRLPKDFDPTNDNIAIIEERLIRPPGREEGVWVAFPQGLFRLDLGTETFGSGDAATVKADAADLGDLLTSSGPRSTYTVVKGTSYRRACEQVLSDLGLSYTLEATGKSAPADLPWPAYPETSWWDILRDLADGINYRTPWPDERGRFRWRPKDVNPANVLPDVTYTDADEPRMIVASTPYERERNASTLTNVCTVVIEMPGHPDWGFTTRANADPASPISTANRVERREVLDADSTPNTRAILDADTARLLAETTLQQAASSYRTARLVTFPDPRRGAHEYVRLHMEQKDGELIEDDTLWQVARMSRGLSTGGKLHLELRRATSATLTEPEAVA